MKIDVNADKLDYLIDVLISRLEAKKSAEIRHIDEENKKDDLSEIAKREDNQLCGDIITANIIAIDHALVESKEDIIYKSEDVVITVDHGEDGEVGRQKDIGIDGILLYLIDQHKDDLMDDIFLYLEDQHKGDEKDGMILYLIEIKLHWFVLKRGIYSKYLFWWNGAVHTILVLSMPKLKLYSKYLFIWHERFQTIEKNSGTSSFEKGVNM